MADDGRSQQLDRIEEQVAQRVREAVESLRDTVRERLRSAQERLLSEVGELVPELPSRLVPPESLEPLTAEAGSAEVRRTQGALVAALAAIDRARSQSEVLAALAREAGGFAERTAVLLARAERAEVWTAHGWPGALDGVGIAYPGAESAWSPERFGRGALELDAAGCALLAAAAGAPAAEVGVLVPLVLRDRLAAALYADAGWGHGRLQPAALQVLAYTAALALETLPFRQRAATSTLLVDHQGEAPALWTGREGGDGGGHGTAMGLAAAGVAAAGLAAAGLAAARRRGRHEEEAETPPAAGPEAGAEAAVATLETTGAEPGPGPEVAAPPVPGAPSTVVDDTGFEVEAEESDLEPPPWEATPGASIEPPYPVEDAGFEEAPLEEAPLEETSVEESAAWTLEDADDTATAGGPRAAVGELEVSEPLPAEPPAEAPDEAELGEETEVDADLDLEEEEAAAAEPAATLAEPALPGQPPGHPGSGPVGFEAKPPATESAAAESAPAAEPSVGGDYPEGDETRPGADGGGAAAVPPTAAPGAGGDSQVRPPQDLEGPGSAFRARGEAQGAGDTQHEEARRLARLLVSEIRLYNEEEVEAGRRNRDIYDRLKEDIDRSRQVYEDQVKPEIRESTDYFYEELVRNLGGGDASALGI